MEKWMVILGIWAMCATCAVLFIRGAMGGSDKRGLIDAHSPRPASRASSAVGGDARAALHD